MAIVASPPSPPRAFGAALSLAALGVGVFVVVSAVRLAPCAGGHLTPYCEYYLPRPGIFVHMAGGLFAAVLGLVQVGLGVTGRTGALHRWLGRVYLVVVALSCAGGLLLLQTLEPPYSPHYRIGLTVGLATWGLATAWAYGAARRGAYVSHGRWMLRGFVTSQLFVVFRLVWWPVRLLAHDWFVAHQVALEGALAWLAWCVPLLVLEGFLRRLDRRRRVEITSTSAVEAGRATLSHDRALVGPRRRDAAWESST